MNNPLVRLQEFDQSPWFDYIRHSLLTSGELKQMIEQDGLKGVTSNPAIFEKAIVGSSDYAEILPQIREKTQDPKTIYETLAVGDVQLAADIMWPVYEASKKRDGYVSLEVSPYLARDTQGTIEEARRLWRTVNKANIMIKVPATDEGIPAIRQLISEGINVNVTLLFSVEAYEKVAQAYLEGLTEYAAKGGDVSHVASVASFFVSRIDTAIDAIIEEKLKAGSPNQAQLKALIGNVAIANAKLAFLAFKKICEGQAWTALAARGAQKQRLLWASTGTKNPAYRDTLYVEELIGPETVNTIPPATFNAFRDHGQVRASLAEHLEEAHETLEDLSRAGIDFEAITGKLLHEGLLQFADAFDKLLGAVDLFCKVPIAPLHDRQRASLPSDLSQALAAVKDDWRLSGNVRRFWGHDARLWTGQDEGNWLGWLTITDDQLAHLTDLEQFTQEIKQAGFEKILLLGMGGSSLCPEVLKHTFGRQDGFPELLVLDSTDPAQVRHFREQIDPRKTLFIVSSKSGGTLEPNIFKQYFFDEAQKALGAETAGKHFVAITDPGSKVEKIAQNDGFRRIFAGVKSIGGRYSALSNFGMVPAAAAGIDLKTFLSRTQEMVHATSVCVPLDRNPGVTLGLILGAAARQGRNKVTLVTSPSIRALGAWLEQLLAESTGKEGKGLIPVDGEDLGAPEIYGQDRIFAYIRDRNQPDAEQDQKIEALERAGQPVVRIDFWDKCDLGQEFFRWEIATAVAGSVLGINAFNQPDVEASKIVTRELTSEYEKKGSLPEEKSFAEEHGLKLFADERNVSELRQASGQDGSVTALLKAHLRRLGMGDYAAFLAYVEMTESHGAILQKMRLAVRDRVKVATVLGFGPRFLHSTGQAYKGGPNSGVFLQITADDAQDLPVPGQKYTFGVVKAAQARGDFAVLAQRGRRALRIHLGSDVAAALRQLHGLILAALA
ncbi:MAG TPA: bifunctional transaldolase/phosoglucose isomerase [Candidatus Methylacidiphilales bacterium]|nr:bifunctional transaldolase/phosoglucose isomerase [Candidatus Methylacidiphilales bacterium]